MSLASSGFAIISDRLFVDLVGGDDPGFLQGSGKPLAERRQRKNRIHIGARLVVDRDRIRVETGHQWGIHGVRRRESSKQERSAPAEAAASIRHHLLEASGIASDTLTAIAAR